MDPCGLPFDGASAEWAQAFAALVGTLPEAAVLTDEHQAVVYVNDAFGAVTGYVAGEVVGRNLGFLRGPATDEAGARAMDEVLASGASYRGRFVNYRKDGSSFWNDVAVAPIIGPSGQVTHFVGLYRDISEAVASRSELLSVLTETEHDHATSSALLHIAQSLAEEVSTTSVVRAVAEALPGLCGADRSAVALWDPVARRLSVAGHSGWPPRLFDALSQRLLSVSTSSEIAGLMADREPELFNRSSSSELQRSTLESYQVEACVAIPVHSTTTWWGLLLAFWEGSPPTELGEDLRARLTGVAGLTAVALQNAQLLEETHWAAAHDPLTGLPNRTTLELRLAQALEQADEPGATAAVFCDVNGLKRMNDSFGHAAGDRVLREVAVRLRSAVRAEDTVSRVGGDEFVIVLAKVRGEAEVQGIIRRIEDSFTVPVEMDGREIPVSLSMGLAFSSSDPAAEVPPRVTGNALIRAADLAMYQRKNRSNIPLSQVPLGRLQRLSADLPGALDRREMFVHYQPQVDLTNGAIVAVEALARWAHPTLGPVGPSEFISIAEMTGEVAAIGTFVLETACGDIAVLRQKHAGLTFAVNVSNDELDNPGFAGRVRAVLEHAALPGDTLTLEITESKLPADRLAALDQLQQLRSFGVGISLDDFGTGYTSLLQLRELPVTEIKVDRSYIEHSPNPGADLLASVVGLTHGLHLRAIAEGVSTEEHRLRVREAGFDRAQGYLFAHAMSASALATHLETASVSSALWD